MPRRQRSGESVVSFDPAALRRIRTERGLTIEALAQRCGVPRPSVSNYEAGRTIAGIDTLQVLASVLGVDPLDLTTATPETSTLADLRARAGVTRSAMAAGLGIARDTWDAMETGRRRLQDRLIDQLAAVLSVTAEQVVQAHARGLRPPDRTAT